MTRGQEGKKAGGQAIILLSGGLDSLVSLGVVKEKYNVTLALTFDYGQKSAKQEIEAAAKISRYYGIEHRIIELDWLKDITNPNEIWVPNRNGLFLNIAASFADSEGYDYIIFGANKEEAQDFPDNTTEFVEKINAAFEFSTLKKPKVIAPLIDYDKNAIVKLAIENAFPLELVQSCYNPQDKHCGECESCIRLKNALEYNIADDYIKKLF